MLKMVLSQPEIKMKIAPAKVVYQGGGAPYKIGYGLKVLDNTQLMRWKKTIPSP